MIDYYEILEITPNASPELIKKQFRKLSLKYHPDKNKGINSDKFILIKEAYDILIDEDKRNIYDYQRKFSFLKDYDLHEIDIEYLYSLYEKINNSYQVRFCKILFNTMPDKFKENFYDLKERFFNEEVFNQQDKDKDKDNINKDKQSNEIVIPPKYIDITNLKEDYLLYLNISFEDIYNGKLKRIIIHTTDYICYLFLRIFDDIKIQNGSYTFHIKFVNKCKANFIKKGSDLLYIKNINMYELLFQDKYDIILPNAETFILNKTKSNVYCFKDRGFLRNNYKKGNLYVIFNLDYHKDYSKYKDCIKEIFE